MLLSESDILALLQGEQSGTEPREDRPPWSIRGWAEGDEKRELGLVSRLMASVAAHCQKRTAQQEALEARLADIRAERAELCRELDAEEAQIISQTASLESEFRKAAGWSIRALTEWASGADWFTAKHGPRHFEVGRVAIRASTRKSRSTIEVSDADEAVRHFRDQTKWTPKLDVKAAKAIVRECEAPFSFPNWVAVREATGREEVESPRDVLLYFAVHDGPTLVDADSGAIVELPPEAWTKVPTGWLVDDLGAPVECMTRKVTPARVDWSLEVRSTPGAPPVVVDMADSFSWDVEGRAPLCDDVDTDDTEGNTDA